MTSFRLAAVLALLISGLAIAATAGAASASTAPGHTIASAGTLAVPDSASGGGGPIDFWKVTLSGGDDVQFTVPATPYPYAYEFALFAPGTTDTSFPDAKPFIENGTNGNAKTVFDLQAPYTGTFILAVCQGTNGNCPSVENGNGVNPMNPYTFTTTFYHGVPSKLAAAETKANGTIAGTRTMGVGHFESGGANGIDFWKMSLSGGADVQFTVPATPYPYAYYFALYAPGTTDTSFLTAKPFIAANTNGNAATVLDLRAPYTGTFILAVCQGTNGNCPSVENGNGVNPMNPYTFTTTFYHGVPSKLAAAETKAGATIAKAPKMGLGHFESGGANGVDFWKLRLSGGDDVQFTVPATPYPYAYYFALFAPGTTDTSFPTATALVGANTNGNAATVLDLRAPYTGTFILAVCQGTNGNCPSVENGNGVNPMNPYVFTSKQIGGLESKTSLRLSAGTVTDGHEKSLKFSVTVSAVYGGHATGKVAIWDGKKTVCVIKLINGKGSCSPPSNTTIPTGTYTITAFYAGNKAASKSATVVLTVKK